MENDARDPNAGVEQVATIYRDRAARFADRRRRLVRRADRVSHGRAATFLSAVGCLVMSYISEGADALLLTAVGLLLAEFVSLVWLHRRVLAEAARYEQLCSINEQGSARLERRWREIPLTGVEVPEGEATFAEDLDLFGHASLFQLTCTAGTPAGIATLGDWLLHPADPAEIIRRQQAVAELAGQLDLRQELHLGALGLADGRHEPEAFLRWAEGEPWLAHRRWLLWAARVLPASLFVLLALGIAGVVPQSLWLVVVGVNLWISVILSREVHPIFGRISSRHGDMRQYGELFARISDWPATSAELSRIRGEISSPTRSAHRELSRLGRIMDLANFRFSPMVYSLVQYLALWDFHVLALLERWQRRSGTLARRWFEALGQWEALASLASLSHDNPAWTFPVVDEGAEAVLEAGEVGHPLLSPRVRVTNDVTVGPPGTFLLVTGSNMSGKSTLLRSLGTNVVLAQAGAAVCAAALRMPPLRLVTSMRVDDSLEDGVSFFLAELKQLKRVVDSAREYSTRADHVVLYLLDEILQGTNTAERQIAVRRVLSHLLSQGAIGAVSTHDLELAASPALAEPCRSVHFRETIHNESGRRRMTFDYKLRPGIATTTNALKLLDMVGLAGDGEGV
ncbi:MAG TPA: DNA mismatch repair protein [Thermoguttaceae bacterium]|nr:DNA mismatch repair protein [Thermoguttaceae bacterium]